MSRTEMLRHVQRPSMALRGDGPLTGMAGELLVTVVTEVTDRDGVVSVYREGPEVLVVDARGWDEIG